MVQVHGPDLRSRVIKPATNGMSAQQAAERFGVGTTTAIVRVRRYRQSEPRGFRLDAHAGFILALVDPVS